MPPRLLGIVQTNDYNFNESPQVKMQHGAAQKLFQDSIVFIYHIVPLLLVGIQLDPER